MRAAARAVADAAGLPGDWLNDAVKGYLSNRKDFHPYLELSNLRVLTASPEYLLAGGTTGLTPPHQAIHDSFEQDGIHPTDTSEAGAHPWQASGSD